MNHCQFLTQAYVLMYRTPHLHSLFIIGAGTIERFDPRCNEWTICATMTGRRLQFGVAVLDSKLFIVGGRDGLKTLNSVECFNNKTNSWTSLPPVATHRHGLGKNHYLIITLIKGGA